MFPINPAIKAANTQFYVLVHYFDRDSREQYLVSTFFLYVDSKTNKKMRAELGDDCFYVYEDGSREKCKKEERIYFYDHKNTKCSASLKNLYFVVEKSNADDEAVCSRLDAGDMEGCAPENEHRNYLRYKNWNNANVCTNIARWVVE